MSAFKVGDRVRDISPHAAGLGTSSGTIIGKDEGDNWEINWDATPFSRINWYDHQIELIENPLQAEIERLRAALTACLEAVNKAGGTALGVAMSGKNHPNPDGALMEVFQACQKASAEGATALGTKP